METSSARRDEDSLFRRLLRPKWLLIGGALFVAAIVAVGLLADAAVGQGAGEADPADKPRDPLIRAFDDLLGDETLSDSDREKVRGILRDSDGALQRIRRENREALRQVNRQTRLRACDRFNVVLIVLDDVGYGDLGPYGQQKIRTPRIDQLAAEGVRFTQFYAGSATGTPSRGTLFSGYHTGRGQQHGDDWVTVRRADHTLAEVMWLGGFDTGMVGKWGLGDLQVTGEPNEQGFDYWFGYLDRLAAENYFPEFLWRNREKVELRGNLEGRQEQYSPELVTQEAISFLHRERGARRPFFLTVAYTMDHANTALFRETGNGMQIKNDAPYTDQDWPQPEKNKAAMITRVDALIGEILDSLDETEQGANTIVILTSDNGPHADGGVDPEFFDSNGALRGIKGELYDGGIRVPLIIRGIGWRKHTDQLSRARREESTPSRAGEEAAAAAPAEPPLEVPSVPTGMVSHQVWAFWDLLPTLADMTGTYRVPRNLHGRSMAHALAGGVARDHEYLYWEMPEQGGWQAVRTGDWKAVRKAGGAWELYDLKADAGEATDIAGGHADVIDRIEKYVARARVN